MTVLPIFNQVATVYEVSIGLGLWDRLHPFMWDDGYCDEYDFGGDKIIPRPVIMGWDRYGNDVGVCRIRHNGYNLYNILFLYQKD